MGKLWILLFVVMSMFIAQSNAVSNSNHEATDALYNKICEVMMQGSKLERCKQDSHNARDTFHSILVNSHKSREFDAHDTGLTEDKIDSNKTIGFFNDFCLAQTTNDTEINENCYNLSVQGFDIFKRIFHNESLVQDMESIEEKLQKTDTKKQAIMDINDIGQFLCSQLNNETSIPEGCKESLAKLGEFVEKIILSPEFENAVQVIQRKKQARRKRQQSAVVAVPVVMAWLALVAAGIPWWG